MNLIVTLDDGNGMTFNHRRQSRDRVLNERILTLCGGHLTVNAYTAKLFADTDAKLTVDEDPLTLACENDWCFAEDLAIAPFADRIGKLVVFRWNRSYPSDRKFDLSLADWKRISQTDFAGSSHEKITEEIYIK